MPAKTSSCVIEMVQFSPGPSPETHRQLTHLLCHFFVTAIINALSNLLTSINDADSMREPPHVLSGLRPDRWKELQELPLSLTDALQGLRRATVACKKRPGNALTQGMLDLDPDVNDACIAS